MSNLNLYYNELSGNIPAELGNLSNLAGLNLKGNPQLDKTTIPVEVQQLCDTHGKRCIFFSRVTSTIPSAGPSSTPTSSPSMSPAPSTSQQPSLREDILLTIAIDVLGNCASTSTCAEDGRNGALEWFIKSYNHPDNYIKTSNKDLLVS